MSTPTDGATRRAGSWRATPDRPIGIAVIAAVTGLGATWVMLPLVATILTVTVTLVFGVFVIGEGLAGV